MKLSAAILEYELKKHFHVDSSGMRAAEELRFLSPLMYDQGETEDNRIYVLSCKQNPVNQKLHGTELFIFCGQLDVNLQPDCSALYTDAQSEIQLFNIVQRICEKYRNWELKMCQILTDGHDVVQKILDLSADVHENMFELMDANFTNAFVSYPKSIPPRNATYNSIIRSLYQPLNMEIADQVKQAFLARRDIKKTMYHHISVAETLDYPLHKGGLYLGMLAMLPYARPFGRHDYAILSFLGEYIAYALSVETIATDKKALGNLQDVFVQLLDSKHIPKRDIFQLYPAVGFEEQDAFVCVAIQGAGQNTREFSNYISTVLESTAYCAMFHLQEQYLAMVINVSLQERNHNPWQDKLCTCIKSMNLQAGISEVFFNFQLCELYFRSATETLKLLAQDASSDVYYFRDYKYRYALEHFHGALSPEMMYTEGFKRLLAYESTVEVSYIETLKVYLEENLNASSTARRLYISRNTFLARYERLCKILGDELNQHSSRFMLEVSIWLHENIHGQNTYSN